jgi:hypothetical protein
MHSEGFSFYFGGLGVEMCSLDTAFVSATVGNRWQPLATVGNRLQPSMRTLWPCIWGVLKK